MADLKATEQDRLYLSGAIHRMGERTGAAAERILDDLDTLLAENAKLRAVAEVLRAYAEYHGGSIYDATHETEMLARARTALAALEAP